VAMIRDLQEPRIGNLTFGYEKVVARFGLIQDYKSHIDLEVRHLHLRDSTLNIEDGEQRYLVITREQQTFAILPHQ
jgi:hypothetical protein